MKKIKVNILFACLIVILIGSSCSNNQFNSVTEQTPSSTTLSSMLLETRDLSGNWKWTLSNILQGPVTPSPNNNLSTEIASSALAGHLFVGEEKYTFTIYHSVETYDPSIPYVEPSAFTTGAFPEPFSLHFVEIGDEMEFECSKLDLDPSIFFCGILLKYKSIESILRITGEVNAGKPLIEEVINQILTVVDGRIERGQ